MTEYECNSIKIYAKAQNYDSTNCHQLIYLRKELHKHATSPYTLDMAYQSFHYNETDVMKNDEKKFCL